jgi:two-component system chemotaxis sensor kinase CheA
MAAIPVALAAFLREARERLQAVAPCLLRAEDGGDPAVLGPALDAWRWAEAAAGPLGLAAVARLCAAGGQALAEVRAARRAAGRPLIDELLALDGLLAAALEDAGQGRPPDAVDAGVDALLGRLAALPPAAPAGGPTPPTARPGLAPDLVRQFTAEALDSLTEAESALLQLEQLPADGECIHRVFRAVHSIKGASDLAGLAQIKTLSHRLENVLELARGGRVALAGGVGDLVFRAVDELRSLVQDVSPQGEKPVEMGDLLAALDAVCRGATAADAGPTANHNAGPTAFEEVAGAQLGSITDCLRRVAAGDASDEVLAALRGAADAWRRESALAGQTDLAGPAGELLALVDAFRGQREQLAESLRGVLGQAGAARPTPPPAAAPPPPRPEGPTAGAPLPRAAAPAAAGERAAGGKTMRVDQHKLDEYITLAGELVIARNALSHVFRQFQAGGGSLRGLKDAVEKVERIIADVQNNAMAMRLTPVGAVFQRFPRLVRDLSRTLNKQIEVQLIGEETELDKQVAEALGDPLVHLVRNAADHGIEAPERRRAAGKSETGLITLRAEREGGSILIEILDDGAGIDAGRLKEKAVARGLLTAEQAAALPREAALELIFAPGLSTAAVVSDLSGRGVGMDVVRSNLAALGGTVSVESEPGQGTRLRLVLPLTLAVSGAVLVTAGGSTYALPMVSVRETLKVGRSALQHLRGQPALSLRGRTVVLRPLADLLGAPAGEAAPADGRLPVVILEAGGDVYGVIVDGLKGQQEVVVKPLPPALARLPGVGGATIMGDGSVVLVLDPAALHAAFSCPARAALPDVGAPGPGLAQMVG